MCNMNSLNPKIKNFIISKYREVYNTDINGVKCFFRDKNDHLVIEINYRQVHSVSAKAFAKAALERGKVYVIDDVKVLYVNRKWQAQAGFSAFIDAYNGLINNINRIKTTVDTVRSQEFKFFMLDVLSLVLNIREGYLTFTKMGSILITLYTSYMRFHKMFAAQAGPGLTDLVLGFTVLGAPVALLEKLKAFTSLTGKRVIDSEIVSTVLYDFLQLVKSILEFMHEPHMGCVFLPDTVYTFMVVILDKVGSQLNAFGKIKRVAEAYTKYVRNPQEMFDPNFRESIIKVYDDCKGDESFLDYVMNGSNKYFSTTWQLFKDNIVKSVTAFEESRRDEPVCFVFEGEPGSGKSALMNMFVDLLRRSNKTVYCHAFPASEDGKDFYDDYENQEVFVIDDIGQQGVSQWRYIINFVSPVKYPLPCATASKKNTKFFNSKVIVCTTNALKKLQAVTKSDCISDLDALKRRCHVITVNRTQGDGFAQTMQYFKFDHMDSKQWEPSLLHHNAGNIPVEFNSSDIPQESRTESALKFIWRLYTHIVRCEEINRGCTIADNALLDRVLRMEPEAIPALNDIMAWYNVEAEGLTTGRIVKEWYESIKRLLVDWFTSAVNSLCKICDFENIELNVLGVQMSINPLACVAFATIGIALWYALFRDDDKIDNFEVHFHKIRNKILESGKDYVPMHFTPQSYINGSERVDTIRKFCKTIRIKEDKHDRSDDVISQCVVSGNKVLLPAHIDANGKRADMYSTYEHYKNNHTEVENVQLKLLRGFSGCDMAVYELNMLPIYKHNRNLFLNVDVKYMDLHLVNSLGSVPVMYGLHVQRNKQVISYGSVMGKYNHEVDTGYVTPYSGNGACGTVLVDAWGGIVGYHVAGNGEMGFCVVPSVEIADEIRSLMLSGVESRFDLDDKVIPNFSGVRLRYEEGEVKTSVPLKETAFAPTIFHESFNSDMVKIKEIFKPPVVAVEDKVGIKQPPLFREGNITAQDRLVAMSQKTFMHQGFITSDEAGYIGECLDSMMTEFTDLDDEVVAFGNHDFQALNKDSSNGYGCLRMKEDYFDFENKIILPTARELIEKFARAAVEDNSDYSVYLCKESFKDELLKEAKIRTPRTFRVMPLGHIWWTKKIFGNLITHFRDNKHKYGCSIGFNPYKDFAILAERLQSLPVTGDVDFAKWDGSVMAHVMEIIMESMLRRYVGTNGNIARFVFMTMWNSQVLVGDSVWSTTHGLPSGTWLTLLLNCLINKALTALVLYRNKPKASVEDFHKVVDYVMGDDKIFGCDADIGKYYNLKTIEQVATSLGMTCTNGDKTPIKSVTQPFHKLSFVKRNFVKHVALNKWMGALSIDTLHNTLQWWDTSRNLNEVMEGKMRSVQVEAYIHSPLLFEEYTKLFYKHYPFAPLFNKEQVHNILNSDDGYFIVADGMQKDARRWM